MSGRHLDGLCWKCHGESDASVTVYGCREHGLPPEIAGRSVDPDRRPLTRWERAQPMALSLLVVWLPFSAVYAFGFWGALAATAALWLVGSWTMSGAVEQWARRRIERGAGWI